VRSSKLTPSTTYSLFRHPITPTWEHPSHLKGGKWSGHLRKHLSARLWEQLLLALIGDAFSEIGEDEVTGVTLSVKNGEDVLSIWNRNGSDGRKGLGIRRILREVVDPTINWEYTVFEVAGWRRLFEFLVSESACDLGGRRIAVGRLSFVT
jgi:translation initiation factor 4E